MAEGNARHYFQKETVITVLDEFIEKEITRLKALADQLPCPEATVETLNEFFRSIVCGQSRHRVNRVALQLAALLPPALQ